MEIRYLEETLNYEAGQVLKELPREVVNVWSMEVWRARMDGALSNLEMWKVSCLWQGDWNWMGFKASRDKDTYGDGISWTALGLGNPSNRNMHTGKVSISFQYSRTSFHLQCPIAILNKCKSHTSRSRKFIKTILFQDTGSLTVILQYKRALRQSVSTITHHQRREMKALCS